MSNLFDSIIEVINGAIASDPIIAALAEWIKGLPIWLPITGVVLIIWLSLRLLGTAYLPLKTIARWRLLEKAGLEGWKSLIPIYRRIQDFKVAWVSEWGVAYYLVWLAAIAINIISYIFKFSFKNAITIVTLICVCFNLLLLLIYTAKLSRAYGHGFGWFLGLLFFGDLFYLMIAFGKSKYNKPKFNDGSSYKAMLISNIE